MSTTTTPTSPPPPAPRSVPSGLATTRTMASLTLRRLTRGRALGVSLVIAALPVAYAAAMRAVGQTGIGQELFAFEVLVLAVLAPMLVGSSIGEEIEDRTTTYLWSRPVPRWAILAGKLAALAPVLRFRWLAIPLLLLNVGLIVWLFTLIPQELAPLEDRENIRIVVTAPEGSSYEFTESWMDKVALHVDETVPEVFRSFSIIGGGGGRSAGNTGTQSIYLKPPSERTRSQSQIADQLSREMLDFTGVRAITTQPPTIGDRRSGQPLSYVLQAPNLEDLIKVLPEFLAEASKSPVLKQIDADLKVNRPEGIISINRKKAAELGISVEEIGRTLDFAYSGRRFGYFLKDGKQYQVIAQMQRQDRNDPGDVKKLFVKSGSGEMVSLDNLLTFSESASPAAIYRFNRAVSATIQGTPAPGKTLGDGIEELDRIAEKVLRFMAYGPAAEPYQFVDDIEQVPGDYRGLNIIFYKKGIYRPLTPVYHLMQTPGVSDERLKEAITFLFEPEKNSLNCRKTQSVNIFPGNVLRIAIRINTY